MERVLKYKLAITDETGNEHLKLETEVHENHYRGDQELYATMLIKAIDVSVKLMPEADKEKWNSMFERLLDELGES